MWNFTAETSKARSAPAGRPRSAPRCRAGTETSRGAGKRVPPRGGQKGQALRFTFRREGNSRRVTAPPGPGPPSTVPLPPHTCIARPRKAPGTATTHVVLRGVPSLLHVHHVGVQHAVGQHLRAPRGSLPALAAPSAALPAAAMPAGAAGGSERGRTPRRRLRPVRGGGGSPHARRRPGPASTPCPQPPAKRRREGRARPRLKAAPGRRGARGARTAAPVWWGARPALRWRPLTLCGGPRGPAVSRSRPRAAARGGLGRSRVPGAIRYCSKRPKFGQQRSRQRAASRVLSAAGPVPQGGWPRAEAPTYSWAAKGSEPEKRCANYPPGGLLATDLLQLFLHTCETSLIFPWSHFKKS